MKHVLSFVALSLIVLSLSAQYKNDNILFKTIDPSDLCSELLKSKGYLLLDVRTKGENADTSFSASLNIGHLKDAKNIDVRELGGRLGEIKSYKDQPVFVYCSHSQRSRRASKMLADSGYTKVYNINGGMTAIYYTNAKDKDCLQSLLVTGNKYTIISESDVCNKLSSNKKNVFVLDVRSDSAFRHISSDAKANAYGNINGAVNIPLADLPKKLSEIPIDKEIIVTDLYGGDAARAANILKENKFENVDVLIEGIDRWLAADEERSNCTKKYYVPAVSYHFLNSKVLGDFINKNKDYLALDVRSTDEFANKAKDNWRNAGHVKNAINIPAAEINDHLTDLEKYKNKDILIYSFGTNADVFNVANTLTQQGYKKIYVLMGGLFSIRWTANNTKGHKDLLDLVTDVPAENL